MGKLFLVVAALAVAVVICEEEVSKESLMAMSKDELVKALTESHTETDKAQSQLLQAKKKMRSMKRQISDFEGKPFNEKKREQRELKKKKNEKKAEMAKRAEVLKKKEKLSDLLMNHGANFLAEKVAKDTKSKGSIKQKAAVRKAAIEGARAGATGPLRKVARAAAIKAVKATRLEAKKKHIRDKKKIRQMTTKAAKAAVKKLLDEQEAMVQKAADKWVEEAIKKHPATVMLAEHEDKPNHFTAPPVIHLSLDDNSAANQVQQLKEDSKKHSPKKAEEKKKQSPKKAEKKPEVVHISLGADPAKKSKKHETVAKAASKAKKAAGKIVKEH
jgi:hypothetical protein